MSRIRIALFMDEAGAEPVRRRLVRAGIPAEIHYEPSVARLWFVSKRGGGIRLEVPANHSERSSRLLLEWDTVDGLLHSAIRCPECRSLRVDFPQFTEKSLFTNLVMGLIAVLRLVEREYYCESCHCMWLKPSTKPRQPRRHMAPNYFIEGAEPKTSFDGNADLDLLVVGSGRHDAAIRGNASSVFRPGVRLSVSRASQNLSVTCAATSCSPCCSEALR
jgi:hypothetical protein